MAYGKIVADQIEHSSAGSLNTQYVVNGSAKAWINFNGTGTIAIRNSLNTSSITDQSTGSYRTVFSNNMSATDYCANLSGGDPGARYYGDIVSNSEILTTGYRCYYANTSATPNDMDIATTNVHGDLA